MLTKLPDTQLWQQNLALKIRSGLFCRAEMGQSQGLYTVVGIYRDQSSSTPLAKYSDARRALDAANLVNHLAQPQAVESD